ncbi:MAG TPA: ATP-binding protein [Solirubrobacteraceae bacterium]|nr:ATP-binding protein [Solirubrobacteraceae bacterium]
MLTLIAVGLYVRFESQLDETINQGLRSRAGDVALFVQRPGGGLTNPQRRLVDRDESFAQVLELDGTLLDASAGLRNRPLLTPAEVRAAAGRRQTFLSRRNPFEAEPARLLATPVGAQDRRVLVVVGTDTDDRDATLRSLLLLFVLGGPLALLLASLAGYGVASAALAPVEQMRRKAAQITDHTPGERLPVGRTDDEIARLGTTLNTMLERLERSFERERAFVADASHELRTPLAILKTEIELALREGRTQDELLEALRSAAEETDRLAELAEALLIIARADGGKLALAPTALRSDELLDGVRERFAARLRASDRALVVDADAAAALTGDRRRLEQALGNLVENALQHGAGTIHLATRADADHVELHVRDEGPGFPPEFVADAFERFTRADPARTRGGSGLGLSIVQVIAGAHGGIARAANHPGGGADVWIELPLDAPAPATDDALDASRA